MHFTAVAALVLSRTVMPVLAKFVMMHPAGSSDRSTSVTCTELGPGWPFHIEAAASHASAVAMLEPPESPPPTAQVSPVCLK